mmetsp:Transcript_92517/g.258644  ORF Transcript_92517/g.258644 Transcript_92517/m.258644 type:complete len:330 (-) Transcript_92517:3-992(-)
MVHASQHGDVRMLQPLGAEEGMDGEHVMQHFDLPQAMQAPLLHDLDGVRGRNLRPPWPTPRSTRRRLRLGQGDLHRGCGGRGVDAAVKSSAETADEGVARDLAAQRLRVEVVRHVGDHPRDLAWQVLPHDVVHDVGRLGLLLCPCAPVLEGPESLLQALPRGAHLGADLKAESVPTRARQNYVVDAGADEGPDTVAEEAGRGIAKGWGLPRAEEEDVRRLVDAAQVAHEARCELVLLTTQHIDTEEHAARLLARAGRCGALTPPDVHPILHGLLRSPARTYRHHSQPCHQGILGNVLEEQRRPPGSARAGDRYHAHGLHCGYGAPPRRA